MRRIKFCLTCVAVGFSLMYMYTKKFCKWIWVKSIQTIVGAWCLLTLMVASYLVIDSMITKPTKPGQTRIGIDFYQVYCTKTPNYIKSMYKRMKLMSGYGRELGNICVVESGIINAFVTHRFNNVYITKGMLKLATSPDEVAAVLGHEIGHIVLGHTTSNRFNDNRRNEFLADIYGLYLVQRIGLDPCAASKIWAKMYAVGGVQISTSSHPASSQRMLYMNLPQCNR